MIPMMVPHVRKHRLNLDLVGQSHFHDLQNILVLPYSRIWYLCIDVMSQQVVGSSWVIHAAVLHLLRFWQGKNLLENNILHSVQLKVQIMPYNISHASETSIWYEASLFWSFLYYALGCLTSQCTGRTFQLLHCRLCV